MCLRSFGSLSCVEQHLHYVKPMDDELAPLERGSYYKTFLRAHHFCGNMAVRFVGDAAVGYLEPGGRLVRFRIDQIEEHRLTAYEAMAAAGGYGAIQMLQRSRQRHSTTSSNKERPVQPKHTWSY